MAVRSVVAMLLLLMPCVTVANAQVTFNPNVQWNLSGTWEGELMGSQVVLQVNQNDNSLSGVATIYKPSGKRFSSNFSASIIGSNISGAAGGFSFFGNVISQNSAVAMVRAKDGRQLPVRVSRK